MTSKTTYEQLRNEIRNETIREIIVKLKDECDLLEQEKNYSKNAYFFIKHDENYSNEEKQKKFNEYKNDLSCCIEADNCLTIVENMLIDEEE